MTRKPYRPNFIYRWAERAENRPVNKIFTVSPRDIRWYEWVLGLGAVALAAWLSDVYTRRPVPAPIYHACEQRVAAKLNLSLGECLAVARRDHLY